MTDTEAVAPAQGSVTISFTKIKREQDRAYDSLKENDEIWKRWTDSPTYVVVKRYILSLIEELDNLEGNAFERGASLEEIGLRRAVNRLTKESLMSIIRKAEETAKIVKNDNKK